MIKIRSYAIQDWIHAHRILFFANCPFKPSCVHISYGGLFLKGYPSLAKTSSAPLTPPSRLGASVHYPLPLPSLFSLFLTTEKTNSEGLPVPPLTRGDIPKAACVRNGSPGLFQIGVYRPRWDGNGMGGRSLSLLSWREGSWASGVVDFTDVGQERICQGSRGVEGGLIWLFWWRFIGVMEFIVLWRHSLWMSSLQPNFFWFGLDRFK